jgi:lipopolysaccharide export system protein LptA
MIRQFSTAVIMLIILLNAASGPAAAAVRVAVLPFEIYSDESAASLKDIIAGDLSSQLAADKKLEVVDQARVRNIMAGRAPLTFNEATLRTISEKLDAPFLVLGSMTRIGANMSLDAYIFRADATPAFTKQFSQGKNLEAVTREMAAKVNASIAKAVPPVEEEPAVPPEKIATVRPDAGLPKKTVQEETVEEAAGAELPADEEEKSDIAPAPEAGAVAEKAAAAPMPEAAPPAPAPVIAPERRDAAVSAPPPGETEAAAGKAAQEKKEKKDKKEREGPLSSPFASSKPVKITSESLEADNKKSTVTFKGNVVAKQEDMVIVADTMTVDYEQKGGIKTVQASGNVKMSQADRVATGTRIIFYNPEQKIVMTGNPKIWQGDNLISCDKITVLLEEDRIFFEGKVDSTIFPKSIQDERKKETKQIEAIPAGNAKPATAGGAGAPPPR